MNRNLTKEEEDVILNKGTETPFSGKYGNFYEDGVYCCKQCGQELFDSNDKFDSGTGWPSFDDIINNSIKELLDLDGRRIEIVCSKCSGHLGHVFRGENMTKKSVRYCVNSISLKFCKR